MNVSPDKLATGLLFDSLLVDCGPERAGRGFTPLKAAFLEIPVVAGSDPECHLLGYTFDLRGHVDVTAGARASLVLAVGGESRHVDFPFDNAVNGSFFRRIFFLSHTAGTPGKTVIRSPLRVQLILSVETAGHDDAALLSVDSLDVEARRAQSSWKVVSPCSQELSDDAISLYGLGPVDVSAGGRLFRGLRAGGCAEYRAFRPSRPSSTGAGRG